MSQHYILKGKEAVPAELMEWAQWFAMNDRKVRKTQIQHDHGKVKISTVFLGLDHQFLEGGDPLIFETMVFGEPLDREQNRCSTWEQAEDMHKRMVRQVQTECQKRGWKVKKQKEG